MILDKSYGLLNLLEFKCDHFSSSLFQAESQFQNSNISGKYLAWICVPFSRNAAFSNAKGRCFHNVCILKKASTGKISSNSIFTLLKVLMQFYVYLGTYTKSFNSINTDMKRECLKASSFTTDRI